VARQVLALRAFLFKLRSKCVRTLKKQGYALARLLPRLIKVSLAALAFYANNIFAATTGAFTSAPGLGTVASSLSSSFSNVAKAIEGGCYIAGMGFALSSMMKFKQHKENPTQVPIGTPIALLFIAAALVFLPTIFGIANQTLFSGSGQVGGASGFSS
jgi:intracellular multiplication protein IcmD